MSPLCPDISNVNLFTTSSQPWQVVRASFAFPIVCDERRADFSSVRRHMLMAPKTPHTCRDSLAREDNATLRTGF
jgi:hypothetical protein